MSHFRTRLLSAIHSSRLGLRSKSFDAIGGSFLFALEHTLGKPPSAASAAPSADDAFWSKSVKEAWTWVFVFVAKVMQPPPDDEDARKRATVRRTWAALERLHAQARHAGQR